MYFYKAARVGDVTREIEQGKMKISLTEASWWWRWSWKMSKPSGKWNSLEPNQQNWTHLSESWKFLGLVRKFQLNFLSMDEIDIVDSRTYPNAGVQLSYNLVSWFIFNALKTVNLSVWDCETIFAPFFARCRVVSRLRCLIGSHKLSLNSAEKFLVIVIDDKIRANHPSNDFTTV